MPIHDWTRVSAGTFHDFHTSWISDLKRALNAGLLPPEYFAMVEQDGGNVGPDVLTLETGSSEPPETSDALSGGVAVAPAPPQVRFMERTEDDRYALKRRTLVIRHSSGLRMVALIEILSSGNKSSRDALRKFVEKVAGVLRHGLHVLVVDLHPPGRRDPQGIHPVIWAEFADSTLAFLPEKPLTLASYVAADGEKRAYVEPVAVGDILPDMPLYLTPEFYVQIPLEKTYCTAYETLGRYWREQLEAPA